MAFKGQSCSSWHKVVKIAFIFFSEYNVLIKVYTAHKKLYNKIQTIQNK